MNLIVDTSIWSLLLRRRQVDEGNPYVVAFRRSIGSGDSLFLLGPILQELLDGIQNHSDFERLMKALQPFPLAPTERETFALASQLRNHCRKKGVQASPVDFFIAASCIENGYSLLTSDEDFLHIAKNCSLVLARI